MAFIGSTRVIPLATTTKKMEDENCKSELYSSKTCMIESKELTGWHYM